MAAMLEVLTKILPVLIILVTGYTLKKKSFIDHQTVNGLKKLVVNISLPALLFIAFLQTEFEKKYIWIILIIFIVNLIMLAAGKVMSKVLKINNPYFPLLFSGFEMGMMGFSLFGAVYGHENLRTMGVIDLGHELFIWFILLALLLSMREGAGSWRKIGTSFLTSPVIIGIISGLFLNISGLKAYIFQNPILSGLFNSVEMISQITIPVILLVVGYQLTLKFNDFILPLKTISLRYLFLLPVYILINNLIFQRLLGLEEIFGTALLILFILPPPFIIPLFINSQEQERITFINNTLSLGTLITIVAFVAVAFIRG